MESISFRKFLKHYSQNLENESIHTGTTGDVEGKKGLRFNEYLTDHFKFANWMFRYLF